MIILMSWRGSRMQITFHTSCNHVHLSLKHAVFLWCSVSLHLLTRLRGYSWAPHAVLGVQASPRADCTMCFVSTALVLPVCWFFCVLQNFSEVLYSWLPNLSAAASRFWEAFPSGMHAVSLFVHTSSSWINYPGSCSPPAKTASSSCSPGNGHPRFSFIFYVNVKLTGKRSHCRFENRKNIIL